MFTHRSISLLAVATLLAAAACGRSSAPASTTQPMTPSTVANTNATVPADPLAGVENRDRVRQYPDETKFARPQAAQLITGFATDVREAPSGDSITTLQTSEGVNEIARDKRGDYYLVVYPDPNDASKKLAGWVYKDALENTSWTTSPTTSGRPTAGAATKLTCSHGEEHLQTDREFCGKTCKNDDGCNKTAGERCDGHAFEISSHANQRSSVNYCVSSSMP